MGDFWVFGYGSLIWRPGFAHIETRRARLHRLPPVALRLLLRASRHARTAGPGARARPWRLLRRPRFSRRRGELRDEVIAYLRERELVTSVYLERTLPVRLESGETVEAVAYIVDRDHEQYAGALDAADAAAMVAGAVGQSGHNEDYVISTVEHLAGAWHPRPLAGGCGGADQRRCELRLSRRIAV